MGIISLCQFFWWLRDNMKLLKMLQNASYFVRECDLLEQNRQYFLNQQPKICKKQLANMMHGSVVVDHSLCMNISGLIDDNETVETAALRELKEETGYKGEVVGVTPGTSAVMCVDTWQNVYKLEYFNVSFPCLLVTCLDPGLSNCTTQMVMVHINGDDSENINPTQQLGEWRSTLLLFYHRIIHTSILCLN